MEAQLIPQEDNIEEEISQGGAKEALKPGHIEQSEVDLYLRETRKKIDNLITIDTLTQIHNRRAFEKRMGQAIKQHEREIEKNPEALKPGIAVIDIDKFKQFNDNHGHEVGDQVLKKVAKILEENTRKNELIARYGGEEFVLVTPEVDPSEIAQAGERLRKAVEEETKNSQYPITISVGTAVYQEGDDVHSLFNRGDAALYKAKDEGRNKSVVYTEGMEKFKKHAELQKIIKFAAEQKKLEKKIKMFEGMLSEPANQQNTNYREFLESQKAEGETKLKKTSETLAFLRSKQQREEGSEA